jgi:chemotaxis protein CheZ
MITGNQYIGFRVDENEHALPILKVREIIRMPGITELPDLPEHVIGVTNLRGSVIPVVDLHHLTGKTGQTGKDSVVIVLTEGHSSFGVIVDSITGVINIDDNDIAPPESFMNADNLKISGVAKLDERLLILLDAAELQPSGNASQIYDDVLEVREIDENNVEVTREVETIGGTITVREIQDAREYFNSRKKNGPYNPKIFELMMKFMDALASHDYDRADELTTELMAVSENSLFKEVGRITRNLHSSLKEFKSAIDQGLQRIKNREIHDATDSLEEVLKATEEAANDTMSVTERYFEEAPELISRLSRIKGYEEEVNYIRMFKENLDMEMNRILTAQEFQDITGQTIKRVINLVRDVENELLRLIRGFGIPVNEQSDPHRPAASDSDAEDKEMHRVRVDQSDVEALLKDYGF